MRETAKAEVGFGFWLEKAVKKLLRWS